MDTFDLDDGRGGGQAPPPSLRCASFRGQRAEAERAAAPARTTLGPLGMGGLAASRGALAEEFISVVNPPQMAPSKVPKVT